jgi:hypothetical protein
MDHTLQPSPSMNILILRSPFSAANGLFHMSGSVQFFALQYLSCRNFDFLPAILYIENQKYGIHSFAGLVISIRQRLSQYAETLHFEHNDLTVLL